MENNLRGFTKEQLKRIARNNGMQYRVRANKFVSSNLEFYLNDLQAYSYNWWRFTQVIDGKLVFNDYSYSVSTSKHQWKVWGLLRDLGIKKDITIYIRESLTESEFKYEAIKPYYRNAMDLIIQANRKGTTKKKNVYRRERAKSLIEQAEKLREFGCVYSKQVFLNDWKIKVKNERKRAATLEQRRKERKPSYKQSGLYRALIGDKTA